MRMDTFFGMVSLKSEVAMGGGDGSDIWAGGWMELGSVPLTHCFFFFLGGGGGCAFFFSFLLKLFVF